jgi:hypothetical protein
MRPSGSFSEFLRELNEDEEDEEDTERPSDSLRPPKRPIKRPPRRRPGYTRSAPSHFVGGAKWVTGLGTSWWVYLVR